MTLAVLGMLYNPCIPSGLIPWSNPYLNLQNNLFYPAIQNVSYLIGGGYPQPTAPLDLDQNFAGSAPHNLCSNTNLDDFVFF